MPLTRTGSVTALVYAEGWPAGASDAVLRSLQDQVARVLSEEQSGDDETETLLVITSPVVFAHGAVERLRQMAAHPGRVVTRVLVPDVDPASVSLWSARWFARERVGVDSLRGHDLDFDRQRLPHDDARVRAWVRAEDIGVASWRRITNPSRWARTEEARLRLGQALVPVRSVLGRIRRTRSLARQRRRQHA